MGRFPRTFGVALALHALAAWLVARDRPRAPREADAPSSVTEIAIEVPPPAPSEPAPRAPTEPRVDEGARVASTSTAPSRGAAVASGAEVGEPSAPAPAARASSGGEGTWTLSPFAAPRVDLGLGASGKYASGRAAREESDPARSGGPPLTDDRDVGLGLARGGAATGAAIDETRASRAPVDGWAVLDVVANALGHVTEVKVIDVSEDWAAWQEVADKMVVALRERTFRIPARAGGLVTRVRVASQWVYPDGKSARGARPPAAVGAITMPITVALGGDPTESERAVRSVHATIVRETPLPL